MLQHLCAIFLWIIHLSAQSSRYKDVPKSPACSRSFSKNTTGTIESPRGTLMYGGYRFCSYAITVAPNRQISLKFEYARLITFDDFMLDYVVLFDGPDCMNKRTAVVQRNEAPTIVSTSNQMTALFVSTTAAQFRANYSTVFGQNRTEPVPLSNYRIFDNCGDELNERSGTFAFKSDGRINVLCIWRITVGEGNIAHLRFTEMKMDSENTWLRVLDGGHCGASLMKLFNKNDTETNMELKATSNQMTVVYSSPFDSDKVKIEATYWEESTTTSQTTEFVPSSTSDLVTDKENMANNPAVVNRFDLAANSVAYALVGSLVLLLAALIN